MTSSSPANSLPPGVAGATDATSPQYTVSVGNDTVFTLPARYTPLKSMGRGAYGSVISASDSVTGQKVAIKLVSNAFDDLTDSKRVLRECMLLRHFRHENIVSILDIIHPRTTIDNFKDVYIVMDLCDADLHRIVYSRQALTDEHAQYFTYQVLRALKYIHSAGVIHRDIKPSNLLIDASCDLKICDFGLARGVNDEDLDLTEYVVTRWYRAPEIMLSCKTYGYGVDVWSTGCILAEILGRKPLFPGENYIHLMTLICDTLGSPSQEDLAFVTSERARRFVSGLQHREKTPFSRLFPDANPNALDLLDKMLAFNPAKRITVDEALAHPYLASFSEVAEGDMELDEDINPVAESLFVFPYENVALDAVMLRELMWGEMANYHPEAMADLEERRRSGNMRTGSKASVAASQARAQQHQLHLQHQQQMLQQQQQQRQQMQQQHQQQMGAFGTAQPFPPSHHVPAPSFHQMR